jgi:hypothetical protein
MAQLAGVCRVIDLLHQHDPFDDATTRLVISDIYCTRS